MAVRWANCRICCRLWLHSTTRASPVPGPTNRSQGYQEEPNQRTLYAPPTFSQYKGKRLGERREHCKIAKYISIKEALPSLASSEHWQAIKGIEYLMMLELGKRGNRMLTEEVHQQGCQLFHWLAWQQPFIFCGSSGPCRR